MKKSKRKKKFGMLVIIKRNGSMVTFGAKGKGLRKLTHRDIPENARFIHEK